MLIVLIVSALSCQMHVSLWSILLLLVVLNWYVTHPTCCHGSSWMSRNLVDLISLNISQVTKSYQEQDQQHIAMQDINCKRHMHSSASESEYGDRRGQMRVQSMRMFIQHCLRCSALLSGHFSGQLGDGATMYLGEIITSKNERVEIQFKGAGQTPYSRRADGRKVLRSSIREFLCSEANHYLGVPTTRAGTIVTSDTKVERDIFYDGNAIQERATIITRLAHSFIRFGSFEIAKGTDSITGRKGPSAGKHAIVQQLLDYVVNTFYADVTANCSTPEEKYLAFFRELTRRTAVMVARWQTVGFCHGVMNTDNMSILGITIDYGPYGYMEAFDPEYICNGSDNEGRYRYEVS